VVLYLLNQESPTALIGISRAGRRLPANCTALGKALLAQLPDHEVEARFGREFPVADLVLDRLL
jgi:IclR family transcriptional regulator, KDG regulon repressor